jgi:hypothetical protein
MQAVNGTVQSRKRLLAIILTYSFIRRVYLKVEFRVA